PVLWQPRGRREHRCHLFIPWIMQGTGSQPAGMAHGGDRQNALLSKTGERGKPEKTPAELLEETGVQRNLIIV
ncbi:MAG: hypothetical protein PWQ43_1554, partial [Rikenellaceae bacterium]|nr:hypothetical protein [Rikenellaceae bacterium]